MGSKVCECAFIYRVFPQLAELGCVGFDHGSSEIGLVLLSQMRFGQKWLSKMVEHPKSKSNQP